MISFETPAEIDKRLEFVRRVAREQMRPQARSYDEHEVPWDFKVADNQNRRAYFALMNSRM